MIEAGCKCSETGFIKHRDTQKNRYVLELDELEIKIDEEPTFSMKQVLNTRK